MLAVWNDDLQIKREEYESWLRWRGLPDAPENLLEFATGQVLSRAAKQREVSAGGPSAALIEQQVRLYVLSDALAQHLRAGIEISEAQIDQTLQAKPDAFKVPKRYKLRNLFLALPDDEQGRTATRERMASLRQRAMAGEDFTALAEQESESDTRFKGGRLGLVKLANLPPVVASAVEPMQPGDISQVIEFGQGLFLFWCEDIEDPVTPPPEDVRRMVRQALAKFEADQMQASLDAQLLASAGIDQEDDSLTPRQRQQRLVELRAQHAESLSLDRLPATQVALRWRTMQQLAMREMDRRVEEWRKEPTEAELREAFAHRTGGGLRQFRVAGIAFGEANSPGAARAREVLELLQNNTIDFEQAARTYSTHKSAAEGGDLGWLDSTQLASRDWSLSRAARKLAKGEITLVSGDRGVWIYKLLDRREGQDLSLQDALPELKRQHRQRQTKQLKQRVRDEVIRTLKFS
ncbi:peptidylprolyl isomerase [Pseudomarimonas arenosa]|uniref:peptidylprolyl isomerase n=1 Tax=Pseudomarimonas arenosa TaxID=2774145 RepID=A0AAW3ZQA6_9GAMM|nr:peptidylprolyl isomerase [Pseudomarimonas arenosa]